MKKQNRLKYIKEVLGGVTRPLRGFVAQEKGGKKMIYIPLEVYEKAESLNDIEDWLWAHNKDFVAEMKRASEDIKHSKLKSLKELKKELSTK